MSSKQNVNEPLPASGLFSFVAEIPRSKSNREIRAEQVDAWKAEYGIQTHCCRGGGDWMAVSMPECIALLEGYGLTDAEKTSLPALMAGYCRLLDEAGVIEDGHATEFIACEKLTARISEENDEMTSTPTNTTKP